MARPAAILRALATLVWRDGKSFRSLVTNNFFLFSVYLLRSAGSFVYLILALVVLFPLCADPLRKIPAERLASWPITRGERRFLRAASPWVNPMTWFLAAMVIWAAWRVVTVGVLAVFSALFTAAFLLPQIPGVGQETLWRCVPRFPGRWGELVQKNIRGLVSTLDFYSAAILSLSAGAYHWLFSRLPPEASLALTLLVLLALSSYAQCLFGLDGSGGMARYRLLPCRGWQILAAKGSAFLAVVVVLTLPLAPLAGLAGGLIVLAIGQAPSVNRPRPQSRWRFSSGASLGNGVWQVFSMGAAGAATSRVSPLLIIPCFAIYAASLWWFGRALERGK
jgi:hypothetical protein